MTHFQHPDKMSKSERQHMMFATDAMMKMEEEVLKVIIDQRRLPQEWHEIWHEQDRRDVKRMRVTARMDADVVRFFKAMGEGYQNRMNRVLRAYMHMRLAKMVEGPDTSDFVLRPDVVLKRARERTEWGDMERLTDGLEGA